jgi:hypothetical protein
MGHLDALIAFLLTKQFQLDTNGPEKHKAEKHRDRLSNLWRYLRLSVMPKVHLVEAHAIGLCKKQNGFGCLDKDEDETVYQTGEKDEKRYGNMADYKKKARSMSQYGQMKKNLKVAARKEELKDKTKRKVQNPRKSAEFGEWRQKKYVMKLERLC